MLLQGQDNSSAVLNSQSIRIFRGLKWHSAIVDTPALSHSAIRMVSIVSNEKNRIATASVMVQRENLNVLELLSR